MTKMLLTSLAALAISWILWRYVLQSFVVKSSLDKLPGPRRESLLSGNLGRLWSRHGWDFHLDVALNYGPVLNVGGFFNRPYIYISDTKALHSVLIKDQKSFEETGTFLGQNMLAFGPGLLSTSGDIHRRQRKMLNPFFSAAHMRVMTPIFYDVADKLCMAITSRIAGGPQELDMLDWLSRTALEVLAQGGLGYSLDPLVRDASDEYGRAIKSVIPSGFELGVGIFGAAYVQHLSASVRKFLLSIIPSRRLHKTARLASIIYEKSIEIYTAKKTALEKGDEEVLKQIGAGKDIMSVLIKANMQAESPEDQLPEEEVIAQISTMTFAAMDTTSNTLSGLMELLARHLDVQERLRSEVVAAQALSGDRLSYDELMQLPYLDAVCRETLRVHPVIIGIAREALKDTVVPLSKPVRCTDGEMINELLIPKGTQISVGTLGVNFNKNMWGDDALEWKPERWLSPLPESVLDARVPGVYSNMMTFLGGNRSCIGFKFAELEMKLLLATLLPKFQFELTDKPIYWNMGAIRAPSVGKDSDKPEMFLRVRMLQDDAD